MAKKTAYLFENIWTIPNIISFIRILLIPVFGVLFYKGELLWALLILAFSGFTDFIDGKLARKLNQVSELGKMLDPIADKLTQATIAIVYFFTFRNAENETLNLFAWVFLLFILKELVMLVGGAIMIAVGIRPGAAEIYGKAATLVFYVVMVILMAFGPEIGAFRAEEGAIAQLFTLPDTVMMVLVVISLIMTIIAFLSYMPGVYSQVKERFGKGSSK
ncbi:MAG: CDP-alcohol phosphatidyltransferase family protein [Clostridia bacterium]|nr:CDP-alcohol phosphatidyltransferase family protein [Clostridia bacterium]